MQKYWHSLSSFFEDGDLTPFAVIISIAHYGPVLAKHGEHIIVAYAIGTLVDLIHFRTIRRAFMPHRTKGETAVNWLVAIVTTAMATMYHLRFYSGDWLLSLPIPLGVAILAYHAAGSRVEEKREVERQEKRESRRQPRLHIAPTSSPVNAQLPSDYRLLTVAQKEQVNTMTSGELAQMADISASTARRWKQKVSTNGYHK